MVGAGIGLTAVSGFEKISCKMGINNTRESKLKTTKSRLQTTTNAAVPLYKKVYLIISLRSFTAAQRYINVGRR
jgi:hypothetical protein